jgi:ABC-type glycerol-3-phosphate transport system permease component
MGQDRRRRIAGDAPVLIFSLAVRRYLVSGLTAGAMNG